MKVFDWNVGQEREYDVSSSFSFVSSHRYVLFPGFVDVHVHLREPGFSYKERIFTGTRAAARGGYTAVCCMPNLNPCPDTPDHMRTLTDLIERDAAISVFPYATITVGEKGEALTDFGSLKSVAIAFSDDGKGVQDESLMRSAMQSAAKEGVMIVAHCEDNRLLNGGYIHDGDYARRNGHRGISSESEWRQIERDLRFAEETGAAYHVCHISTKESVSLIRAAKARGVNVTCETAPHYLVLDESDLREDGRFKMNPPLREKADRLALIDGIIDGTIDMIVTDHAPHAEHEKAQGLEKSAMGIVGLETAFPVLYTEFVSTGVISLEKLIELMSVNPRKRFGIPNEGETLWDLSQEYKIDANRFLSMGRATPFDGRTVRGKCLMTKVNGRIVWSENLTER